jgi:hypothetical protein
VSEGVFNPEHTEDSILRGVVTAHFHAALHQILAAALRYAGSGGALVGQVPANHG